MGVFTKTEPPLQPQTLERSSTRHLSGSLRSPAPFNRLRAVTAAARPLNLADPSDRARVTRRSSSAGSAWQPEAWDYYDEIGEIKFAFSMISSALSRIRLVVGQVSDPGAPPEPVSAPDPASSGTTDSQPAIALAALDALRRLDSAFGGQSGLLRDAAINLCIPGECYLVQVPARTFPTYIPETWNICSTDELEIDAEGRKWLKPRIDAQQLERTLLPPNSFIARIWRPHARFSEEPDSSMRGVLDACAELTLLNRTFRATARSRLNAGMLYIPDGLSVASSADPALSEADEEIYNEDDPVAPSPNPASSASSHSPITTPTNPDEEDAEFEEALMDAMSTPIADESSASAVVPLIVRGPADLGDKIKLIKFERSFDPALAERCDRVLERILQGLDVPKDLVIGLANVKYANAVVIDESLYRTHIEPLALLLCDALTVVYLRPALKAAGFTDPDELSRYVVWYDPSEVTSHPNKLDDSSTGYTDHIISGASWRRHHGFNEGDAPDPTETMLRMLIEKGTLTPELSESLMTVIAPEVMSAVRSASQASNPAPLPDDVASAIGTPPSAPPDSVTPAPAPAPAANDVPATEPFKPGDFV